MNETQISEAATVMLEILHPWDQRLIHKAWLKFAETGTDFPPNAGQLITLAKEIRKTEYDERQRELFQLPEPETEVVPMPDEIREKIENLFKL